MDDSLTLTVPILENNSLKTRQKKGAPVWIHRPYRVWRTNFQQDRCCSKKNLGVELLTASYPIISLNLALVVFIIFGSHMFKTINDDNTMNRNYYELVLFSFTTIATIGYGDISPDSFHGKLICMLYCVLGIPLLFTTIATNSMILVDVYNIVNQSIYVKAKPRKDLPWQISLVLLVLHILLGACYFSFGEMNLSFISALYFSFISISTIGFGDIFLQPTTLYQTIVYIMFLSTGIGILSTFFGTLQSIVLWIHNIGRKLSNSGDAEIWFGGNMMTVRELVCIIAEHFDCTPEKLRDVLRDLDAILAVACEQSEEVVVDEEEKRLLSATTATSPVSPSRKKTVYLHLDKEVEDVNQLTVHSFVGSNQRTLPKNTEMAIQALGAIQHTLRKPSTRGARSSGHSRHHQQQQQPLIQNLFTPAAPKTEQIRKIGIHNHENRHISV